MKAKFKILIVLLALLPFSLKAEEFTRNVHKGYLNSQITALDVSNKFGAIEINDFGGDSVTVDVIITVETNSEDRAEKLMDLIQININRSGGVLNAQTVINDDFKSKQNFSIDYKINIPKDRNLTVANKFGNVAVQSLEAAGNFDIAYGNMTAGTLNAPGGDGILMELSYGKADLESVNKMTGEIKYSKVFIGQAGDLNLETKYSGLNVDELNSLNLESKYDGVKLGRVGTVIAESKYTNYTLDELSKELSIDTEYGSVRVGRVLPDFSQIQITNSYGGISLGMDDLSYQLDASCDYCDVKYPVDDFQGNRAKDNASLKVQGNVGTPTGAQKVIIKSRYGGIKLN
ncbi:hypothetical protein [Mangrovibacterium lignilyticum]|uniref:hypothetical protein n=1 Tax=Mangrovibacterium lignilyticum TaxID=2668052 RepID=UPI0013D0A0CC|nr:hypothetical protein [Mangrovibacterium lignilyticum]